MSLLPERQRTELNKAVLQYLEPLLDDEATLGKLCDVLKIPLNSVHGDDIISNYLEKKWSTVLRLQKKILDLETELSSVKELLESKPVETSPQLNSNGKIDWIPQLTSNTIMTQSLQRISALQIHPIIPEIFCGCSDGSLIIWNMISDNYQSGIPDKTIRAHTRGINRLQVSPTAILLNNQNNSKEFILATCSADLSIKLWNVSTYNHVGTLSGHEHTVSSVAFSTSKPDILYSVSRDKSIRIWDIVKGICIKSFVGHSDWVRDIDVISYDKINPNPSDIKLGDFILTCSNDLSVRLLHADSGTGLALLIGHTHVVERVKFLPLLSNFILDKILVENTDTFPSIPKDVIENKTYETTLGYKYCVTGGRDNLLKLWLLPIPVLRPNRAPQPSTQNSSQGWHIADMIGHLSWVKSIWIHPNGKYIFSAGDDKTIKIWDLSTLSSGRILCVRTLNGHEGFVNDITMAPIQYTGVPEPVVSTEEDYTKRLTEIEGSLRGIFVSGGVDNTIRVWS